MEMMIEARAIEMTATIQASMVALEARADGLETQNCELEEQVDQLENELASYTMT